MSSGTARPAAPHIPARARQKRRRLRPSARKLLLSIHVIVTGAWLGSVVVNLVLLIHAAVTTEPALARSVYSVMDRLVTEVMPPLAASTLLTGILLGLGTQWGILLHYWVATKLALSVAVVLIGNAVIDRWVEQLLDTAQSSQIPPRGTTWIMLLAATVLSVAMLVMASVLSTYKPWGRTARGRAAVEHERARGAGPVRP